MKRARLWGGLLVLVVLVWAVGSALASTVLGLSVEDQTRLSQYVVMGEVINQKGVSHPTQGLETQVTLRVVDVLKGDLRPGKVVTFHTRGGELDGEISEASGEARFHKGQQVLVFIENVDGRLYNLGLSMGVWDVNEDAAGHELFTRAVQDGLNVIGEDAVDKGPIAYADMAARVRYAARNAKFDNEMLRTQREQGR